MQNTNTGLPLSQSTALQKEAATLLPQASGKAKQAHAAANTLQPRSVMGRILHFFSRLFSRKPLRAQKLAALTLAERAAASRAAQMTPPVAFMGDTTSTLITPMGAYAGKPVEQALRKRAEQQFNTMDITRATIN